MRETREMARMRRAMTQRRRRIIYNNDSGDIYPASANTADGFLAVRMTPVLDTQVDSVFYCTGATVMFSHLAEVGETYGKYTGDQPVGRNIQALKEAGHDVLSLVCEFCRKHGLEVFFTHRINDIHDSMEGCDFELATWKREHPELLMGAPDCVQKYDMADPRYWWSSLDFEIQEVRDYLIAAVKDVCSRYDIDGYEVDYLRSPMFFRPNLTFEPATPEQVELLTSFQRRVRETAYREGDRRGRPILVAARVPMSVDACRHVGIDIESWLEEGLLDLLTVGGGYVPFTMPTRDMVELGHAHNVPVYPSISASGLKPPYNEVEAWRGAAANAWHADADGLYVFNTFPREPQHPHFTQLGDPAALAGMVKLFAVDNQRIVEGDLVQGIVQSQILPVALDDDGRACTLNLPVGDDVPAAAEAGTLKQARLRLRFANRAADDDLAIQLNGETLDTTAAEAWTVCDAAPKQFRHGDNTLTFNVRKRAPGASDPITVEAVELNVDYK